MKIRSKGDLLIEEELIMSFCINQIVIRKDKHQLGMISYIDSIYILPDNIKTALQGYVIKKYSTIGRTRLTVTVLQKSIKELLEKCCYKSYENISRQDVKANEGEILYQIQRAARSKSYSSIYKIYKENEVTVPFN